MLYRYSCFFLLLSTASFSAQAQAKKLKATTPTVLFQGVWATNPTENAEFMVNGTQLTYVEFPDRPIKYTITTTTLTIFSEDGPYIGRVKKLSRDSLVYITPGGFVARLYKRK